MKVVARTRAPGSSHPTASPWVSGGELAWLLVPAAALLSVAALRWLAQPVSGLVYPDSDYHYFPSVRALGLIHPEPLEATRFLLCVGAAMLFAAALACSPRVKRRRGFGVAVVVIQALALGFIVASARTPYEPLAYVEPYAGLSSTILPPWGLAAGAGIGLGMTLVATRAPAKLRRRLSRLRRLDRYSPLITALTLVVTVSWLLPGLYDESNVAESSPLFKAHVPVHWNEYAAITNGRTPLVDLIPMYSSILPLTVDPLNRALGDSLGSFTALMLGLSAIALVAVHRVFLLVTRSQWASLALYVPFIAIALYPYEERLGDRSFNGNFFNMIPGRYLGPFVVAWLCVRYSRNGFPPTWAIFAVAALATLNNVEFGLPCFAGSLAAVWLALERNRPVRNRLKTLATQASLGLALAMVGLSVLTLLRSSSLIDLELFAYHGRVVSEGYGMLPMPEIGLHLVLYLTFAAALVAAAVRIRDGSRDRALTGLLAYAGIFGLGAGAYFAGRSVPVQLIGLFPAWGFAICLLAWTVALSLTAARSSGRTMKPLVLPAVAVFAGLGVMLTTADRFPWPAHQVERLTSTSQEEDFGVNAAASFVESRTQEGEAVSILTVLGHRVAQKAGVADITPFSSVGDIVSTEQMDRVAEVLRDESVEKVFVGPTAVQEGGDSTLSNSYYPEISAYLEKCVFSLASQDPHSGLFEWRRTAAYGKDACDRG